MVGGIALLEKACHWRVGFVSEKPSPFPVLPPALLCSYGSRCKVAVSFSGCHVCLLAASALSGKTNSSTRCLGRGVLSQVQEQN